VSQRETLSEEQTAANNSAGATQISGIGYYATPVNVIMKARTLLYAIRMTGDLEGCLYAFIDDTNVRRVVRIVKKGENISLVRITDSTVRSGPLTNLRRSMRTATVVL
jgi:hypothetical protein